ncbi:HD-GYP domain-containing protein [Paenibacillus sp.]|uniref:HD-GYP domain-containing protein n=1 Tax=Paenibacillus sp. TaxID=58172 RepID=UPI002D297D4C|nr:HD-GYP domain-containing protein [Paenibacillus sp.]HZG58376.1 HD-GYP domain-containing protein [Paenibacillus sp.]
MIRNIPQTDRLIWIGQISSTFGLLILSLRHAWIHPALHYEAVAALMLIGFLPSFVYKALPSRLAPYVLVANALFIVSAIFVMLQEWALAGVFVLVPVFALLFRNRRIYILSSLSAFALNIALSLLFLFDTNSEAAVQTVILLDVLTVFLILVFIIYFVVNDLRWRESLEAKHLQTVLTLSQSVEAKDAYTQGHSERVAHVARLIAESLPQLSPERAYNCGLVHDVGKLSIPDSILLKPARLTEEEYGTMKAHTTSGAKLCQNLNMPEEIVLGVRHHHERWDGKGYPDGLRGEEIPLIGRALCVADSIDAMCSNRAYRKALDLEYVRGEIESCSGAQFDPTIAGIVLAKWEEIREYYRKSFPTIDRLSS